MLAPLGPGPEDNVEVANGLDERLRDAVAREQKFSSASCGTSGADAQEQTDWTDTTGT